MKLFRYVVFYLQFFLYCKGNFYSSSTSVDLQHKNGDTHNRLEDQQLRKQSSKQLQKRQFNSYNVNEAQHLFEQPSEQSNMERMNLKQDSLSPSLAYASLSSSNLLRGQTMPSDEEEKSNNPVNQNGYQDHPSLQENTARLPSRSGLDKAFLSQMEQTARFSPENGQTEENQSSLTSRGEGKQTPSIVNIEDPTMKMFSPQPAHSNAPPANQEVVDPSTSPRGLDALDIHMVKKYYPVPIIHKVPKPIPVTHTKMVPYPVDRKVYQYYPHPVPRLFSKTPDVHLSYLHYENRANPCQHGGIIVQSPGGYTCLCRIAYKGKHCQEKDLCYPYPCQNDGDCVDHGTHYECRCAKGYKGLSCDVKDMCYKHPCKNGASCSQMLSDVKCDCPAGYKGQFCQDLDYCHPNPCRNGGKCYEMNLDAACTCTAYFKGPRCQVPRTCIPNLCHNGGTCMEERPSSPCECSVGFSGFYCTENVCEPNPCGNDGVCYASRSDYNTSWIAECKCKGVFKGRSCEIFNPCASNPSPCIHGVCYDAYTNIEHVDISEEGFTCHCHEGYTGTYCRDKKCENCDNNAKCVSGQCVCSDGYHGDGYSCKKISDVCSPNPCENGGTCHSEDNLFECKCAPGFKGRTCHGRTPCSMLDNPCKNGGTCIEHGDNYHCICPSGLKGRDCSDNSTSLCESQPCLNGGTCKVSEDNKSWYCVCRGPRFKPPDCACNCPANAQSPSERNFVCDNPNGLCLCPLGFVNDQNRDVCVDPLGGETLGRSAPSCSPNPCKNGGKCATISPTSIMCQCVSGWTGKFCDEAEVIGKAEPNFCDPNPCKNGGICNVVNKVAVCTCPSGFKPPTCEIKEVTPCSPNPCHNNGHCVIAGHGYDCICAERYTGPTCQVDRCSKCDPQNAICVNGKCVCRIGFVGNGYQCVPVKKKVKNICITCHPVHAVCLNNNCQCNDGYIGNGRQCAAATPAYSVNAQIPWFKRSFRL